MNILRSIYLGTLAMVAVSVAGCYSVDTDDDLLSNSTIISSFPTEVVVGNDDYAPLNVIININPAFKKDMAWNFEVEADWITASRQRVLGQSTGDIYENAVVMTFKENTAYKRKTVMKIKASDGTILEVPVTQVGALPDATVEASAKALTFLADTPAPQKLTITSNMAEIKVVSDKTWCHIAEGSDAEFTVTCDEYDDKLVDRTAIITVTVGTPETSQAVVEIPVTQLHQDNYCYVYGTAVPKYPTTDSWSKMAKVSDHIYADSVYVKNGRLEFFTTDGNATYYPDGAGNLTTTAQDITVDIAGLRVLIVNLGTKTYSLERITTPNCLPDSEVANYETSTYTVNGRTKVWMRTGLNWNGGDGIGLIKLGSRMVSPANNKGGYSENLSSESTVRVPEYDEVESGGTAQGEVEMTNKYGRIYSLSEYLTGTPNGALEITRLLADWPQPYRPGNKFTDAIGNEMTMASIAKFAGETFESAPTLSMQIQGICPYGWHVANVQDFYDMLCAASEAKGQAPLALSAMIGDWTVQDVLRSAEGWASTPVRDASADTFRFDYFPQGRRLFKAGYEHYGLRGEMYICHPGSLAKEGSYQAWRINAMTYNATKMTVSTGYNIGDCAASFRCVKNYENY